MSVTHSGRAGLQAAAAYEQLPSDGAPCSYDSLCSSLLDLSLQQGQMQPLDSSYGSGFGSAASALGLSAAHPLASGQQSSQHLAPLQQLAAIQQQRQQQQEQLQLAEALAAEPLLNLGNLLAAQQGLSVRVQELLLLKQQLQQVVPQRHGSQGGIRGTGPLSNPLYKTELCRSWEETGNCRYGAKCQFAHGREELRPVVRHPKYKTEVCRTFAQSGTCPYGTRCRFIHTTTPGSPASIPMMMLMGGGGAGIGTGSTTPNTGASTPPPPHGSRDPSFASLAGLGGNASTPNTPLGAYGPAAPYNLAPHLLSPPMSPYGASAPYSGGGTCYSGAAYSGGPSAPYGTPSAAGYATPNMPAAGSYGSACRTDALAALAALLGNSGSAAPLPGTFSSPPLTTPSAAVVGPPAGLAPIGTLAMGDGSSDASQQTLQLPICPTTPMGIPATGAVSNMRRSISDSGASTPGGSAKRLPIFERLIPEGASIASASCGAGTHRSLSPPAACSSGL